MRLRYKIFERTIAKEAILTSHRIIQYEYRHLYHHVLRQGFFPCNVETEHDATIMALRLRIGGYRPANWDILPGRVDNLHETWYTPPHMNITNEWV